jgi:hypothetical protein
MTKDNRLSITVIEQTVTDVLGHITAIEGLLPFLINREPGDSTVLLGEKSVGFDEKSEAYIASNPEFQPGFIDPAEVLKDRAARLQFLKFLPQLRLLAGKAEDTFDVLGNDIMYADLAYYNSTAEAASRGRSDAKAIHDDLATRYPGRSSAKTTQPAAP